MVIAKEFFEVKEGGTKGEGLFAKKIIPAGTIIGGECNTSKIYPKEYPESLPKTEKDHFYEHAYTNESGEYVMPFEEEGLLNHSCNSNILSIDNKDIVVRDIQIGEEATYDYRQLCGDHEDKKAIMKCECGEENCCKLIRWCAPPSEALKIQWSAKIKKALSHVKKVEQPFEGML